MIIKRTIKLKLYAVPSDFLLTMEAYTKAFNYVCQVGWKDSDVNGVSLHHKTYPTTKTYLPSQLACSARLKATESLKSVKTIIKKGKKASCPKSKLCSVRLDARSYTLRFDKLFVSILI